MRKNVVLFGLIALGLVVPARAQVFYTGYFVSGLFPQRGALADVVTYGAGAEYMAGFMIAPRLGFHVNLGYSHLQTESGSAIQYVPVKFGFLHTRAPFALEGRIGLASFIDDGYSNSFLTELEAGMDIGNFYVGLGGGSFYHMGTGGRLNDEMGSSSGYFQARLRLRLSARVLQ